VWRHIFIRGHDSFKWRTWLIHVRDMTHLCEGHDSFIWGTWLIHMRDRTHSYEGHHSESPCLEDLKVANSFACVTRLIHTRDRTHMRDMTQKVWRHIFIRGHDSFKWGTWLIHTRDRTHSYKGHDTKSPYLENLIISDIFACETWLIRARHMTHLCEENNSFI